MKKVCIIGAGISGITLAYELNSKNNSVTVIDAGSNAGGCIKSIKEDGYLIESGPNGVLYSKPYFRQLLEDANLLNFIQISSNYTSVKYIQYDGKLHKVPSGPISGLKSKLLTFSEKLRILKEPFIKEKCLTDDETVDCFFRRRLGKGVAEKLISTVIGGIYAGDSTKISIRSAFPAFYNIEQEYGSLISGAAKYRKKNGIKTDHKYRGRLISSESGLSGIISALEKKCTNVKFQYNTKVLSVEKSENKYMVSTDKSSDYYDSVVFCCNSNDTAKLIKGLSCELSDELSKCSYAPVAICAFGFKRCDISHALDGFGFLVNPNEKKKIIGTLFSSTLFYNRAPQEKILLTCITAGDRNKEFFELSDSDIINKVKDELSILGIKSEPEKIKLIKNRFALPQYRIGHYKLVEKLKTFENENPGIFFGGNGVEGASVADCTALSIKISEKI